MSLYDPNDPWGLYDNVGQQPQAEAEPETAPQSESAPSTALVAAADLVAAGPAELLTEAVTPGESKLPLGIAILGACVAAVLFASSIDEKVR